MESEKMRALADKIDPRKIVSADFGEAYPKQVAEGSWCISGAILIAASDALRSQSGYVDGWRAGSVKVWKDALTEKYMSDEAKIAAFEASHPDMDLRRTETHLGYYEDDPTELAFSDFVAGWEEAIYAAGLGPKPYRPRALPPAAAMEDSAMVERVALDLAKRARATGDDVTFLAALHLAAQLVQLMKMRKQSISPTPPGERG